MGQIKVEKNVGGIEGLCVIEPAVHGDASRHNSLLTLCVSKKLLDSNLQLSDFTYFDLNHKGWFSRFTADYALNDHIHLLAGYDWFGGSEGMFGPYKHNSEVWAKAKYCF